MSGNEKLIIVAGKRRRTRVEVYVLNKEKTHVLAFVRNKNELAEFPAGGIDNGESPIDAAVRELQEESGWQGINFRQFSTATRFIWCGKEPDDLTKWGYDEEENIPILCDGVGFLPNEKYNQAGDTYNFVMTDINQLIEDTKYFISINEDSRWRIKAEMRLYVLSFISRTDPTNRPKWITW